MVIGLIILVAALVAGALGNGGGAHALTHPFAVFGYHVTGFRRHAFARTRKMTHEG